MATIPTGKVTPDIDSVSSGVWEIPGTYQHVLKNPYLKDADGKPVETVVGEGTYYFRADGSQVGAWRVDTNRSITVNGETRYPYFVNEDDEYAGANGGPSIPYNDFDRVHREDGEKGTTSFDTVQAVRTERVKVNTPEAEANRKIEEKLWVLVYVRRASTNLRDKINGYVEQNGNVLQDRENFSVPGTDADRDYFFGEDDASDFNTADYPFIDTSKSMYGWEYVESAADQKTDGAVSSGGGR